MRSSNPLSSCRSSDRRPAHQGDPWVGTVSIVLDVADTAFAQLKGVARDGRRSAARRAAAAVHAAANLPDAEDES